MDTRQLRKALLGKPGFTTHPRCPLCGVQCSPKAYSRHTRECERDCASQCIHAIDLRLLAIRNTIPRTPEQAQLLDVEIAWLNEERSAAYGIIFGHDPVDTGEPGWPDDGCSF